MKKTNGLTLNFSEQQLVLLARGIVQAMFDMVVHQKAPLPLPLPTSPQAAAVLPVIGAEVDGAIYAGLSIEDNKPVALWLLPGEEEMNWNEAMKWAENKGGVLPSRFDQLVLFKNLKKEFKETWYWSGEQYAPDPSYAWYHFFSGGYQDSNLKDYTNRVRAVRRSAIQ